MRNRRRAGFTLIEVLLTLVIMAGIMVAITQILNQVRGSRDRIQNVQEQQFAGPAILQQLESDLRALTTFNRDQRYALRIENRVLAGYEADSIDFVCTTDGLLPHRERENDPFLHADINEVGYHLRPNPDSDDFLELYRREDFGVDDKPFEGGQYAFLHDRVKGFEVRVYEEDGVDEDPLESWGDDDGEHVGLPARIEVELTIELAPRLVREQLVTVRNTVTYKRIFRFPASLRTAQEIGVQPMIPRIQPPVIATGGGAPGGIGPGGGGGGGPGSGGPTVQTQTTGFGDFGNGGGGGSPFGDGEPR